MPQPASAEDSSSPTAASNEGQDWNAFGSTATEWGSNESSSQQGAQDQTPPSASWSAFSDSDAAFGDASATTDAAAQQQRPSQSSDDPQQHDRGQQTTEHVSEDESMQNAEFGGSTYWRTHPLALVDEVD